MARFDAKIWWNEIWWNMQRYCKLLEKSTLIKAWQQMFSFKTSLPELCLRKKFPSITMASSYPFSRSSVASRCSKLHSLNSSSGNLSSQSNSAKCQRLGAEMGFQTVDALAIRSTSSTEKAGYLTIKHRKSRGYLNFKLPTSSHRLALKLHSTLIIYF